MEWLKQHLTAKNKLKNLIDLGLLFFILFLGACHFAVFKNKLIKYPFEYPKIRKAEIVGEIKEIKLITGKKLDIELEIVSINGKTFNLHEQNRFQCSFWNDSAGFVYDIYNKIKIGNTLSFTGNINRPKGIRNPGEFDYKNYLSKKGIAGIINCYNFDDFKITSLKSNLIYNQIFILRKSIDERIKFLHNKETAALLKGILLADRSDIDYNIKNSFINSGVIHVLAVSGLHVGFISAIFFLLLGRINIKLKYFLTIFGIVIFLIITGGHASVFRASVMAIVYLIAKLTNRSTNGFNSIAIAAFVILLINPNELFNPGFLLSFSAVLSILTMYPVLSRKINSIKTKWIIKKLLLFLSVSLAAQLGTLPFILVYFNKLSIISLLANLFVIPLIGYIIALAILTLIVSVISIKIALVFAIANQFLSGLLFLIIDWFGDLKFSYISIYNFSILDGIIYYFFLTILVFSFSKFRKVIPSLVLLLLIFFNILIFTQLDDKPLLPDNKLSIVTIDVGQGDSFLIKFPDKTTALIDAGNLTEYFDVGERVIYPLLNRLKIDKIDFTFISHLDFDHFGGSVYLVNSNIINNVYKPLSNSSIKDSIFEKFLKENGVEINYYTEKSMDVGEAKIYLLNDTTWQKQNNFDSNNNSGIIKIIYGNTSFLFVGDAELQSEEHLVDKYGKFLKSDVLKVGHHGSRTSTSDLFLDFVKPKLGIISAGVMNKFKHPSKIIIKKLIDRNIIIRRTDKEGAIILTSDGNKIVNINWRDI